ncbi:MAG: hypothetical protein WD696_19440 [Bryobacteraceae bacterium]
MQELIGSMIRFTTAATLFGMQQIPNAMAAAMNPQLADQRLMEALAKFGAALDALTDVVTAEMSDADKSTVDNVTRVQSELVNRSLVSIASVPQMDLRGMVDTTANIMRKTTDTIAETMRAASGGPTVNGQAA